MLGPALTGAEITQRQRNFGRRSTGPPQAVMGSPAVAYSSKNSIRVMMGLCVGSGCREVELREDGRRSNTS